MRTDELKKLLKARYSGREYALFFEVADGTGSSQSRWADALAINLWPSRGLEIEGFELKVSRTDWQKELSQPEKADAVCRFCDRWSIVAGDASIVRDGELPPTWGLMVANGDNLVVKVKAPKLSPCPVDKAFVAAIARRAVEQGAAADALAAEYKRGEEVGKAERSWELEKLKETSERVAAFEKVTGIDLRSDSYSKWNWHGPDKIGAAVLAVLGDGESIMTHLRNVKRCAESVVREVDELLDKKEPSPKGRRRRA